MSEKLKNANLNPAQYFILINSQGEVVLKIGNLLKTTLFSLLITAVNLTANEYVLTFINTDQLEKITCINFDGSRREEINAPVGIINVLKIIVDKIISQADDIKLFKEQGSNATSTTLMFCSTKHHLYDHKQEVLEELMAIQLKIEHRLEQERLEQERLEQERLKLERLERERRTKQPLSLAQRMELRLVPSLSHTTKPAHVCLCPVHHEGATTPSYSTPLPQTPQQPIITEPQTATKRTRPTTQPDYAKTPSLPSELPKASDPLPRCKPVRFYSANQGHSSCIRHLDFFRPRGAFAQNHSDACQAIFLVSLMGDAAGVALEFGPRQNITQPIDLLDPNDVNQAFASGNLQSPIQANLQPWQAVIKNQLHQYLGQWSDDSSNALLLATTLITCKQESLNQELLSLFKYGWACQTPWFCAPIFAGKTGCLDVGITMQQILNSYPKQVGSWSDEGWNDFQVCANQNVLSCRNHPFLSQIQEQLPTSQRSQSNGSLMCLAPVLTRHHKNLNLALQAATQSALSIHGHPVVLACNRIYAQILFKVAQQAGKINDLNHYRQIIATEFKHACQQELVATQSDYEAHKTIFAILNFATTHIFACQPESPALLQLPKVFATPEQLENLPWLNYFLFTARQALQWNKANQKEAQIAYDQHPSEQNKGLLTQAQQAVEEATQDLKMVEEESYLLNSDGGCVPSLLVAIWAAFAANNLKDMVQYAILLGNDADTQGAITGMLAGAIFGYSNAPKHWKKQLFAAPLMVKVADALFTDGLAEGLSTAEQARFLLPEDEERQELCAAMLNIKDYALRQP